MRLVVDSRWDRFFSEYFISRCQNRSTSAPYSSLPQGQTGEAWEPSKKRCSFRNRSALDEGPQGKQRCSSTISLTSALDGVGGQRQAPAALSPRKRPGTRYRRLGGLQGRSGLVRKISPHQDSIPGPSSP